MEGELIILIAFLAVLGVSGWLEERGRKREKPESISDAQSTSEKGLW